MFLGYARGKVGDVVMYRSTVNNEQMARARNRRPANPRTSPQLYQRAVMATVMRAYSSGKAIFDHSFQGQGSPAKNMARFQQLNARLLRANLSQDLIDQPFENYRAMLVGPGTNSPVPGPWVISEGTYAQQAFVITPAAPGRLVDVSFRDDLIGDRTIGQFMDANGLVAGDIYTFVFFGLASPADPVFRVGDSGDAGSVQYRGEFGFVRLIVRSDLDLSLRVSDYDSYTDLFRFSSSPNISYAYFRDASLGDVLSFGDSGLFVDPNVSEFSVGIIRSRLDSDLRSNSQMVWCDYTHNLGLGWPYVLEGWEQGANALGDSAWILEGGSVDGNNGVVPTPGIVSPQLSELVTGSYLPPFVSTGYGTPVIQLVQRDGGYAVNVLIPSAGHVWFMDNGVITDKENGDAALIVTSVTDRLNTVYGTNVFSEGSSVTQASRPSSVTVINVA